MRRRARGGSARARRGLRPRRWFGPLLTVALTVALAFLVLPVVAIFASSTPAELAAGLTEPTAREALWLSVRVTAAAMLLIVAVGTPAAYLLATRRFRGRAVVITCLELPLVLPPAVAGIALLAAVGPSGIIGGALDDAGLQPALTTAGVVLALTFVAAPFYLRQAQIAFAAVDGVAIDAARTLGSSEAAAFVRVVVPCARPGLAAGGAVALGRALGEFGATLMFAGSLPGVTQTAPLAIYDRFATDFDAALALSAVLVAASAAVLLVAKLGRGVDAQGGGDAPR